MPLCTKDNFVRGVYFALKCRELITRRKEVLYSDNHISLVSVRKGKNKGKYIRLEHKIGEMP